MKFKKLKKGFTLVELVVVIAVIAVLAAVSVGAYFGVTDSAKASNSEAALKQVKDYWMLYVGESYDYNANKQSVANDFVVDFLPFQGYEVDVNYKLVEFYENPDYSAENQPIQKREGTVFVIETEYPTWFLVEDTYILANSPVLKNDADFASSLSNGKYIISEFTKNDLELSTLVLTDGTEVRGTPYIQYTINSDELNNENTRTVNYKAVNSLFESDNSYNPDMTTGIVASANAAIQFGEEKLWVMKEVLSGQEVDYDVRAKNEYSNTVIEKIEDPSIINGYIVKTIELNQKWANLSAQQVDINTYPVVLYNSNNSSFVFYKSLDHLNGNYTNPDGTQHPNLPAANYTKDKFGTYNIILCYGDNARLDGSLTIPEGYLVAIDMFEYKGISSIQTFIGNYLANLSNSESFNSSNNLKLSPLGGTDYIPFNVTETDAEGNWTKIYYNYLSDDENYFDATTGKIIPQTNITNPYFIENNKLTIGKNATLTLSSEAHLFVEARVTLAAGSAPGCGILEHGALYIEADENNSDQFGKIILSHDTTMRSLGKIYGEGLIETSYNADLKKGSKIVDFFKPNTFMGGTITTAQTSNSNKVFPFYSYTFNNIHAKVKFVYGSEYKFVTGVTAADENRFAPTFNGISTVDSSSPALLKLHNNAVVYKEFANGINKLTVETGEVDLGNLNVSLKVQSIGSLSINSLDYQLPITNMNITVNKDAIFNVKPIGGKATNYVFYPSSSIENNGTVNIYDGCKVAFMNYNAEDYASLRATLNVTREQKREAKSMWLLFFTIKYDLVTTYNINIYLLNMLNFYENNFSSNNIFLNTSTGVINVTGGAGLYSLNALRNLNLNNCNINTGNPFMLNYTQYTMLFSAESNSDISNYIGDILGKLSPECVVEQRPIPVATFVED